MKLLSTIKRSLRTAVTTVAAGAILLAPAVFAVPSASAADCDANAVIYCGASSVSQLKTRYNQNVSNSTVTYKATSIHHIYDFFGVSSSDVAAMNSSTPVGSVTSSGNVMLNGKVVATNALTAGRQNIPGSKQVTFEGTTFFTRAPSVSFQSSSLSAFVVMKNGVFQFAIIESCGNAVKATPKTPTPPPTPPPAPTPSYTIQKEVRLKSGTTYGKSIKNVKPGTHVVYRITVKNTSKADVKNLKVNDVLPQHTQYVSGTLQEDGKSVSGTGFFNSGVAVGTLAAGKSTVFTFEAVIGFDQTASGACVEETLNNVGHMTATSLPSKTSNANVNVVCSPTAPPPTVVASPEQPVELSNTGAGSVAGLFAAAALVGGIAHRIYLTRRLTRS